MRPRTKSCARRSAHLALHVVTLALATPACSEHASTSADPEGAADAAVPDGATPLPEVVTSLDPIAAPAPGTWVPLMGHSWSLDPGEEGYWCKRRAVAEDIWVNGLRIPEGKGVHHVTLGIDQGQPGAFRCTGFSIGNELVFGTGAQGGESRLPDGIALRIPAGASLVMNLHLYDTSDEVLAASSIVEVLTVDPGSVREEAGLVLAGLAAGLTVPPGESTQSGDCAIDVDTTILSVGPHMHTRGFHQRVTVVPPVGSETVILDEPYAFEDQRYRELAPPVTAPAGSHVRVECTYRNELPRALGFGESTTDEMCFAGLYHYPRIARGSTCTP